MTDITIREPRTYEPGSPHSFFSDVASTLHPDQNVRDAGSARLAKHGQELAGEYRSNQHSKAGKYVARNARNLVRNADGAKAQAEFRAMTTGSGSGLSFVTPQYLVEDYRIYRENPPSFLEQLPVQDIGETGLTFNVPTFTGPASVLNQGTEGQGLPETDPLGSYQSATLATYGGKVTVSMQLLDRAGPGQSFDKLAYAQMRQEYDQQVDAAVITLAVANATTITNSGSYTNASVFGDIYNARQKLETSAGTKLRPTHAFFLPTPWAFLASQVDSQQRPLLIPAPMSADMPMRPTVASLMGDHEDIPPAGYTGYAFGSVPAFTDGSIPLTGGNATIVVINASSVVPFVQADPTPGVFLQTSAAGNLQAVVRLYGYATAVVVHASGVCAISGSAYSATPSFAG